MRGLEKSVGIGTILDNDPVPYLIVNDVHVTTTKPGEVDAVFAVALNLPSGQDVTVQYATADGVVKAQTNTPANNDTYSPTSGTLDFPAGVTKQLVTVPVQVNGTPEPNENFSLNLTNPVHAKIFYPQGIATVIFADPPPSEFIIDDGEDGYSQTSGWTNTTNTLAYHLDYDYHAPGNGQDAATWTFADIAPTTYQVFVRWSWFSNRATNAPYTVYDGSTPEGTVPVNQQVAPVGRYVQRSHLAKHRHVPSFVGHARGKARRQRQRLRDRRRGADRGPRNSAASSGDGRRRIRPIDCRWGQGSDRRRRHGLRQRAHRD